MCFTGWSDHPNAALGAGLPGGGARAAGMAWSECLSFRGQLDKVAWLDNPARTLMGNTHLMACHECDLLHQLGDIPLGGGARCSRCGASLYRPKTDTFNRSLALTLTGLILFIIANTHPFLGFQIGDQIRETTLATGIVELYHQEMQIIATLVLINVVIVPAIHLLCMLYILWPLCRNRMPRYLAGVLRLVAFLKPWGMVEVFMMGILVSAVKLLKMASIIPGVALFAFMALIFVLAALTVTLDEHQVWERIRYEQ